MLLRKLLKGSIFQGRRRELERVERTEFCPTFVSFVSAMSVSITFLKCSCRVLWP